jgi:hypothetical protein
MIRTAEEEAFRSISAIAGNLARLSYLASLQVEPGVYKHWGLEREYGKEAVSSAFKRSHRLVLENMLQTDFSELAGELEMHAEDTGESKGECLRHLLDSPYMNPFNSVQHVDSHIKYVLESLRALAQQPD